MVEMQGVIGLRGWVLSPALSVALLMVVLGPVRAEEGSSVSTFEPVLVDDAVIGYATFQSHNQKVVSNQYGIFMTYLKTRNDEYSAQQWGSKYTSRPTVDRKCRQLPC